MIRPAHRLWLAWLLSLVATSGLAAAEAATGWLKLTHPEFVVVTSLRQKEAVAWAGEFAQYVAALRSYFKAEDRRLAPLTLVVFARERDFKEYRPLRADGKTEEVAAFFLRHESWSVAGVGGTVLPVEMRHTIFHEGVHWFLSTAEVPNPVWHEEGLAEVFSSFEVAEGRAKWGKLHEPHVVLLRREGLMPLERLLRTGREELFGKDIGHTGKVYAQSWVFAHYLIFGVHQIPPTALADYATHTQGGLAPDEAFRRAFGKTYREMDEDLKRYIGGGGTYKLSQVPLAAYAPPRVEPASRLDVEDGLGRLALGARRWELAAGHARTAIAAGADDPRGHEVLALALKELGRGREALGAFARAEELGSRDAQVPFELALAEQNDGADAMGANLSPGAAVVRRTADRYERAIAIHPRFLVAYQNLAGLMEVLEPVDPEDRRVLEAGKKMWPNDAAIEVGLALLTRRGGDRPAARVRLERVLASTSSDGATARAFARRVAEGWEHQEVFDEIERLHSGEKYSEALALVEQRLAAGVRSDIRVQLVAMQSSLRDAITGQKIDRALRAQQWVEARRLIVAVLAGDSSSGLKSQVGRILADLDRQSLGLESPGK
ncbi:MAG: hypothetical protein NTV51_17660 [Verrucomicrobia bacterium]|nr:hypothetical protein [Verrucomicrobiota bacterium]